MSFRVICVQKIEILGKIWLPPVTCAQTKNLSHHDVDNIKANGNGSLTREAIESWLCCNAGDFQSIEDFHADIADFASPWKQEESERAFNDCSYPEENVMEA